MAAAYDSKPFRAWRVMILVGLVSTISYTLFLTYHICDRDSSPNNSTQRNQSVISCMPHVTSQMILLVTFCVMTMVLGEAFSRLVALLVCLSEGRQKRALSDTCLPHEGVSVLWGVVAIAVVYICFNNWNGVRLLWQQSGHVLITCVFVHTILYGLLGLKSPSLSEVEEMQEKNNLNVAHGLAWSYYMGFLRIILPGLKQRILESDWYAEHLKHTARMPLHMYLLLPESCQPPQQLSDVDERMTHQGVLKQMCVSRAGFVKRPYNNSVYSFPDKSTGQLTYCVVESSASLLTVHELTEIPEAGLSAADKRRQWSLFCSTLADILQRDPNGQLVRLVAYRDIDADGEPVRISDVLSSVIAEDESILNGHVSA